MVTAESLARYFLWLAAQSEEPSPITQMHLHKLLYYAQGWSLASRGHRLFNEAIEAWAHGPVVASVYPVFADYRSEAISPREARDGLSLKHDERAVVESVWQRYRRYSAWQLREMTHREQPWREARGGAPDGTASKAAIRDETLRAFFSAQHETACRRLGTTPQALAASIADARSGRGAVSWSEFKATIAAG